jgi:hypothetical protein
MAGPSDLGALAAARVDFETNIATLLSDFKKAKAALEDLQNSSKPAEKGLSAIFHSAKDAIAGTFDKLTSFKSLLLGTVAALGVGAMWNAFTGALKVADDLKTLSEQTGITTQEIQKLQYAGLQYNISQDKITDSLRFFSKALGNFLIDQSGPGAKAFKQLGLDTELAAGKFYTTGDVLTAVIQKLSGFKDQAIVAGYASQLFGRFGGVELAPMLSQGSAALEKLYTEAEKTGFVFSTKTVNAAAEANDRLETLFATIKNNGVTALAQLAPEIEELAKQITASLPDLLIYVEKWSAWFGLIKLSQTQKLKAEIQDLQDSIASLESKKGQQNWFQKWDALGLFSLSDSDLQALIDADKKRLAAAQGELVTAQKAQKPVDQKADDAVIGNLMQQLKTQGLINDGKTRQVAIDEALAKLSEHATAAQKGQVAALAGQLYDQTHKPLKLGSPTKDPNAEADHKAQLERLKNQEDDFYQQSVTSEKKAGAALVAAQDQTNVTLRKNKEGYFDALLKQARDNAAAQIEVVDQEEKQQIAKLDQLAAKARENGQDWKQYEDTKTAITKAAAEKRAAIQVQEVGKEKEITDQATGALGALAREAQGPLSDSLNTIAANGLTSLGDELASVATGTKSLSDAFSDMVKSIISDLVKLAAQKYVEAPLADALGSLFGSLGSSVTGKASGGAVGAGTPYLVGENGPELFVPNSNGSIMTNGATQSLLGGASSGSGHGAVTLIVQGVKDAQSFVKSEGQVAAMVSRMAARGQRNL